MTTRRRFLQVLGGGVVLAVAGGGAWAATRDPSGARLPWQAAGQSEADPRRRALSYALLAPNPHNRQPWIADLATPGQITLFCATDRTLPHTDPLDRQITVGLGAFIELLVMAAADDGHRAEIELFSEGEPQPRLDGRPVARIRLVKDGTVQSDPLFPHVLARRSNKRPYDTGRAISNDTLTQIAAVTRSGRVAHSNDAATVETLRKLAWVAMETELRTPHTLKESVDLMRIGRAEIEANPDGISLAGPMMEALALAGLLSREAMLDGSEASFRQAADTLRPNFETAMAFLWLATPGNSRAMQIAAGRDYIRLNLMATSLGIAMQPFSQALQEFPEMRPHYLAMRQTLGIAEAETLQMFVRLGYGPEVPAAPRWPLDTRIKT